MKIKNFRKKITLACSKGELRPALEHVYFENGFMIATDARILVKQSLEQHGFTEKEQKIMSGKFLHRETFDEIYRYDHVEVTEEGFECHKGNVKAFFNFTDFDGKYVDYERVVPDINNLKEVDSIGFDLSLVSKIEKITLSQDKKLSFFFLGKNKGVLVKKSKDFEGETIILMPVLMN